MLKIHALNRDSSSDEDYPVIQREAQEEISLEQYNKALRLQSEGNSSEARTILINLIRENIPELENNGGLPHSMSTMKYSCHLNLGNIYVKNGQLDDALDSYLDASELDPTDVSLWYKIGTLAIKQNRFRQAAYAFVKGLECSESHWPCLDQLISLLYAMRETVSCLFYIGRALNIDSNYLKGLVLRKQIYKSNPATREYYQKYNPDYIWEPSLDVSIDEEDEKSVLEQEKALYDKITEAEKSVGPKPLRTIPLPKALDDFSWVSFGKVVTELHQYITDQNMTHFTMVDLTKCMSQQENDNQYEETVTVRSDIQENNNNINFIKQIEERDNSTENKNVEPEIKIPDEEKMETEHHITERRPSQNSDNTKDDGQENTPVQTDVDEEQPMEQDGEDQEDIMDSKTDKNKMKGAKRKRDLLSDLQIWGWHSKRKHTKKGGKTDRDFSVEDALNRIIPANLLRNRVGEDKFAQSEDSMNTMDVYNMYVENRQVDILSPIHSPTNALTADEYFGTERERSELLNLWTKKREYCDAIVLLKDFVLTVSKLWQMKWPKELIPLYVRAYEMYREHFDQPDALSGDFAFRELRDDALATLLYGELVHFSSGKGETRTIHPTLLGFLQNISGWQDNWQGEFTSYFIRVYWLRAHIFRKEGNNDLAIRSLELIQEVMQEEENKTVSKYSLLLPNCHKCGLITDEIVSKIFKHLDMVTSLNCVEALFSVEKYKEVADILKLTFSMSGNHPTAGKLGRPAQLAVLMHSLWFTDLADCFVWTEECLHEALGQYLRSIKDDKWEKIVDKCLAVFYEIIKMETVAVVDALSEEKRIRLVESLTKIVCKQLNAENTNKLPLGSIVPWILLYYVLLREEHRQQASKKVSHVKPKKPESVNEYCPVPNEELPPSIAVLFSAHEFLGPKGWCLTGGGQLLHFILDTILDRLDTPIFEALREKIDIHIEQAMFCLYQHPSKKNKISRHLADHNVDPLSLSWERAFQLYEFYGPDHLPEFNSYKNASISADLEQLFQRIAALVPSEIDPSLRTSKIYDYIQGRTEQLPSPIDFPSKVRAIYYLIGDYYFKQREFNRCVKYFVMDLTINSTRLDSWACIGLSYLSQLENKLNYCKKLKSEMEFLDKAKSARISFRKALDLEKDHIMLWIEYGSFEYMVHSFCSRVMKTESDTLSMEKFAYLENQKNNYLESSGRSFEKAIELYQPDEGEADERWLQYYILGKVAEKQQKEPTEYLQLYLTASKLLHENNATYPEKINYYNPQHLSVEALELHYRMNASILKYLELHEGKDIPAALGNSFKHFLDSSYFPKKHSKQSYTAPAAKTPSEQGNGAAPTKVETTDVVESVKQSESTEESSEKAKIEEINKDVQTCVADMLSKVEDIVEVPAEAGKTPPAKVDDAGDVIMISDSEDEQVKTDGEENKVQVEPEVPKVVAPNAEGNDVQDLLDKMMAETMKKTEEQSELDSSDASLTSKTVIEVKPPEEEKPVDEKEVKKLKSGSETDERRFRARAAFLRYKKEMEVTSIEETSSSPSSSSSSSSSSESDSEDDSSSSSSSSSSGEAATGNMTSSDISALIDRCIAGLEQCIVRLPQNYKALYRLAHFYFNYKSKRDFVKCKQLLLGEYLCKCGVVINGLFSDRKSNNFFNGIWRIPSSEIDRPGSLSAHMSRCITLLLQILRATNDSKTLLDLTIQFRRTPDPDKIYIKDSERMQFSDQAMTMCIQSLRSQIQNVPNLSDAAAQKLLNDIYRSLQLIQKHDPSKESTFASMLTDTYKKWKKDKIPENSNVLDMATKLCQQNRLVEKQKQQQMQNQQSSVLRTPGAVTNPPVLPAPSTVGNPTYHHQPHQHHHQHKQQHQLPLKRPGMGRPRGRPPLPKVPGSQQSSSRSSGRGRGSSSSASSKLYAWQKSMMDQNAMNYLKHCQEELVKQYTQSLSYPHQLKQQQQLLHQQQQQQQQKQQQQQQKQAAISQLLSSNLSSSLTNTFAGQFASHLLARQTALMNDPYFTQMLGSLQALPSSSSSPPAIAAAVPKKTANPMPPSPSSSLPFDAQSILSKSTYNAKTSQSSSSSSSSTKAASITGAKPSGSATSITSSSIYGMNLLQQLQQQQPSGKKSIVPKSDKKLSQSSHKIGQSVSATPSIFSTPGLNYSSAPADLARLSKALAKISAASTAAAHTKTTSSSQFRGPVPSKAHQQKPTTHQGKTSAPLPSGIINTNTTNILMKERPSISITAVMPTANTLGHMTTSSFTQPIQTSPSSSSGGGKTLQEKLADKQKQLLAKNLSSSSNKNETVLSAEAVKKSLNLPTSIPACLSVSKANMMPKFPTESGISISQITLPKPKKVRDPINPDKKENRGSKQSKPKPAVVPTNPTKQVPVPSNAERRNSSDDDVVIIE